MSEEVDIYSNSWQQRPGETPAKYAWFQRYLEMGSGRTIQRVAKRCGARLDLVNKAASAHEWAIRAAEYDAATRGIVLDYANSDSEQALAMQRAVGKAMLDMGFTALHFKNPAMIRMSGVEKLLKEGVEQIRRGSGVADLKIEQAQAIDNIEKELGMWFDGEIVDEQQ